jgi:hypothetical protein
LRPLPEWNFQPRSNLKNKERAQATLPNLQCPFGVFLFHMSSLILDGFAYKVGV